MQTNPAHWLIASDLDGTLLDDGYDLAAAARAVDEQSRAGHSVVLASSKTLDEMLALARLCRCPPVLVFENGAGVAWPAGTSGGPGRRYRSVIEGEGYGPLRARLRRLRRQEGVRFLGFGDLSALEVARLTGLSVDAARLARHRAASEPLQWLDSPAALERFRGRLAQAGYRLLAGGRFHHVMPRTDKARGVQQVAQALARRFGSAPAIVACGDSDNDLAMLAAARHALVFPRRDGSYLHISGPAGQDVAIRVPRPGPVAWTRALGQLLPARQPCSTEESS